MREEQQRFSCSAQIKDDVVHDQRLNPKATRAPCEKDLMGKDIELDIFSMNHDVSYKLTAFRCTVKCHHSYGTISHITVGLLWYTLTVNLVECRVHVCRCPCKESCPNYDHQSPVPIYSVKFTLDFNILF